MNHAPSVVLAGLESAGKSALFRGLSGAASGDEANFRGSTVVCRRCALKDCQCEIVDTPGIRVQQDVQVARAALAEMRKADVVLLVARGTHAVSEVETLLQELDLQQKRSALAITFRDKAPEQIRSLVRLYEQRLGIPVVLVNARELGADARAEVLAAIQNAAQIRDGSAVAELVPSMPVVEPQRTFFEHVRFGPWWALASMALMFVLPVYVAYVFASWAQPLVDGWGISPLKASIESWPALAQVLLTGSYGLLTLGWYSFLWAFPVVALISVSVALAEETGVKDRITAALDPWLRRIGLSGRDLVPVLTGFGCNVVAVFQSRACSDCTRSSCVSMISFGSACSYQIGASLSLFGACGHPGLFFPYLAGLFFIGALHTRLWHGSLAVEEAQRLHERAFLQVPSWRALSWRVKATLKQFLLQAMPLFLGICLAAALLEYGGVISWLSAKVAPVLSWMKLPAEAAPALLFSILRKDGLLMLNQDGGAVLAAMSAGQVFWVVWLASTFTACLVTVWTVRRELGWRSAAHLAGRQAVTSLSSTAVLALFLL
jgi:ferrous iron transport protein B